MRFQFLIITLPVLLGGIGNAVDVQNDLTSPTSGQQFKRGDKMNIRWNPTDPGRRVSLVLHQNDRVKDTIAQDITNSGNYDYTIPNKVKDGDYCLRILEALDNNKRSDVCNLRVSDAEPSTTATTSESSVTTETETQTVSSTPEAATQSGAVGGPIEVIPGSENATVIITATPETTTPEPTNQTITETDTKTVVSNETITETATLPPTVIVQQTEEVTVNSTTTTETSTVLPSTVFSTLLETVTASQSVVEVPPSTVVSTILSTITASGSAVEPSASPAAQSQEGAATHQTRVTPLVSSLSCLVVAILFAAMF